MLSAAMLMFAFARHYVRAAHFAAPLRRDILITPSDTLTIDAISRSYFIDSRYHRRHYAAFADIISL